MNLCLDPQFGVKGSTLIGQNITPLNPSQDAIEGNSGDIRDQSGLALSYLLKKLRLLEGEANLVLPKIVITFFFSLIKLLARC